ncbi:2-isopropylmalate synthase [Microbispora sp. ZYX-F-249]|uniref:2-isopropylmalate synthase n=1 Tax=Microbispora maris TaxID=3144104 RepID=A0ABV0AQQ6_9ACTN
MKIRRYSGSARVPLDGRAWPDAVVEAAPRWLSTDLRDGNQSLAEPMTPARKLMMFDLLVDMGYKEIEVGFPAASKDDYDFVRMLVERDLIPGDVRISVLTQARDELIERTVASLEGAPRATVHLYAATSPLFRGLVFGMSRDECKDLAVRGTRLVMKYAERTLDGCDLGYQFSPEHFNDTEPEFALEVCEAVMDVWQPEAGREIILNFPTTVERATPNVFADQIEWMHRNLSRREHVCLSVHPHNDRGTGVATAELAVMAGADRVEGCLFGNGERAGNVCLVTLGLNLATQGVDPGVDFSDLDRVRRTVEHCTGVPVHPRHPYGGSLVYTAFSGSHQDAIKKGFDALEREAAHAGTGTDDLKWQVPYLPLDPQEVGRTYEAVVRINSQSGKGGLAYVMSARHGLDLPRGLRADFARRVQALADADGGELTPERLLEVFEREYMRPGGPMPPAVEARGTVTLHIAAGWSRTGPAGTDAVPAVRAALARHGLRVSAVHHVRPAGGAGAAGRGDAAVYAEYRTDGACHWGAGIDGDVVKAALAAVRSAAGRASRHRPPAWGDGEVTGRRHWRHDAGRTRRVTIGR